MSNQAEAVLAKAMRASRKDGRLRFVVATAYGWKLTTRRVPFQACYWTNGQYCGQWAAYASHGSDDTILTRDVMEACHG